MKLIIEGSPKKVFRLRKELKLRLRNDKMTSTVVGIPEAKEPVKKENNNYPSFEEFKKHALAKCDKTNKLYDEAVLSDLYKSWKDRGWKDENEKDIKNWKSKLTNTIKSIFKQKK